MASKQQFIVSIAVILIIMSTLMSEAESRGRRKQKCTLKAGMCVDIKRNRKGRVSKKGRCERRGGSCEQFAGKRRTMCVCTAENIIV